MASCKKFRVGDVVSLICESEASEPDARRDGLAVVTRESNLVRKVEAGRIEGGLRARKLTL
jgi:hypothetical protein